MHQDRLFLLLASFSQKELNRFQLFLSSPYFNRSETLRSLFKYIRSFHPDFKIKKEAIFRYLKPQEDFSRKYVTDRMSNLTTLVKQFLTVEQIRKNLDYSREGLKLGLLEYQQFHLFLEETQKELSLLSNDPQWGWRYFFKLWSLHYDIFSLPQTPKFILNDNESIEMIKNLDHGYAILKLRFSLHQKIRGEIFKESSEFLLLDNIIKAYQNSNNPVIQLYLLLLNYFSTHHKEKLWKKAFDLFKDQSVVFPVEEKLSFLIILINFGFQLAINGHPSFFRQLFMLYKLGLNENIFILNRQISEHTYNNIVVTGASIQEFNWTENFMKTYKGFLPENSNIIYFSNAYLEFHKGNYSRAIDFLKEPQRLSFREKIIFKSLQIRCFYELSYKIKSYQKLVSSNAESFIKFLQRNEELSENRKEAYRNFIHLVRLLNRENSKELSDKKNVNKLKEKMAKRRRIIARNWLVEKIKQLEGDSQ